jgi:hypothetical protein
LADTTYLSAFLNDLNEQGVTSRADLYFGACARVGKSTCTTLASFNNLPLSYALSSDDWDALDLCVGQGKLTSTCVHTLSSSITNGDLAAACPTTGALAGGTAPMTLLLWFSCYTEAAHNPFNVDVNVAGSLGTPVALKRGTFPQQLIPYGSGAAVKQGACAAAVDAGMNKTDCMGALATSTLSATFRAAPGLTSVTGLTEAEVINALGGGVADAEMPGCGVKRAVGAAFTQYLVNNATIKDMFLEALFEGDEARLRADAEAGSVANCANEKACFRAQNFELDEVDIVFENFLPAASGNADAVTALKLVFAKYIAVGTTLGLCGSDGLVRGGAACSTDTTCNPTLVETQGFCDQTATTPFTKITSLASSIFTLSPEGLVNRMTTATDALL